MSVVRAVLDAYNYWRSAAAGQPKKFEGDVGNPCRTYLMRTTAAMETRSTWHEDCPQRDTFVPWLLKVFVRHLLPSTNDRGACMPSHSLEWPLDLRAIRDKAMSVIRKSVQLPVD